MNRIFTIFATLSLFALLGATSLDASVWRVNGSVRLDIPVDFHIGDQAFPAGQYKLDRVRDEPRLVQIRSADGKRNVFAFVTPTSEDKTAHVVFSYNGESYDLSSYARGVAGLRP